MPDLSPQAFVEKWHNTTLGERQSYQLHFIDLCRLVDHPSPDGSGQYNGKAFTFEAGIKKDFGGQGFADVYYEDHFAIEYKGAGKHRDLKAAYQQLQQYRGNLKNPPLLIVCDIDHWEIRTNWTGTATVEHSFTNEQIPEKMNLLRDIFQEPNRLHPNRTTKDVTEEAAFVFKRIVEEIRDTDRRDGRETSPDRIAHFITKLIFCLFAEDVDLLPLGPRDERGIFTEILGLTARDKNKFVRYMQLLFAAMAQRGGEVLTKNIPYFNGTMFENVEVEPLEMEALAELEQASRLNWASVDPSIFGTLFERVLDPAKRAQLGTHYTGRADIELIVQPVLMQPLRREWEAIQAEAAPLRTKYDATADDRERRTLERKLIALRDQMLDRLQSTRVLDPACGSGNFLYVALQLLKDMEKAVVYDPLFVDLPRPALLVDPSQLYGIEKDPIAYALSSIVVWIGYIQWHHNNGIPARSDPILKPLHHNFLNIDSIVNADGTEPDWPEVDVIVGNPPFLGGNRIRAKLGDESVNNLFALYEGRVPAFADLVCYWFEKARAHIESGKANRAGLLATNSIRGGVNREVLKRIKESGDIFMAWSDRDWVLDGANVRVSMVGFDKGQEAKRRLDGLPVTTINADLTASVDITIAAHIPENELIQFEGTKKGADFDISYELAQKMLLEQNPSGRVNSDVIHPWVNGMDIVRRPSNTWIIDFGTDMGIEEAKLYQLPFEYIDKNVKPKYEATRRRWWLHERTRPDMRKALDPLQRFIGTARVATHRIFVWLPKTTLPDSATIAIARDDDYFFGVLHSRLHEVWSLRMGTSLEDRPRYTPTTTFETFPFPWSPGHEDTTHPAYRAISAAAKQLHEERAAWLNGEFLSPSLRSGEGFRVGMDLKDRTLTNLYNALNVWRGKDKMKTKDAAADFAPRLDQLHTTLDQAVCDAYGWPHDILNDDEEILRRLLALNLERASPPPAPSPLRREGE